MVDLYTKTILTVIACALVVIAARGQMIPQAVAIGANCGNSGNPCYIKGDINVEAPAFGLPVKIER